MGRDGCKDSSDGVNEYTFYVMTSNLDNHFDIIVKRGSTFDHKKIIRILKKIDRNISEYEFITVSSNNDQKEKEKFDSIVEFMSNLKDGYTENLKCHGI